MSAGSGWVRAYLSPRLDGALDGALPSAAALPPAQRLNSPSLQINELGGYETVVDDSDVLYMTRIQKERFERAADYEAVKSSFELCPADLGRSRALVMHPLPRVNEITPEVDRLPNARYFEQVGYGVIMRMTLLGFALRDGL